MLGKIIKCPYCGKSHYSMDGSEVMDIYVPLIMKDGKVISDGKSPSIDYYTCLECGEKFTNKNAIYEDDKNWCVLCKKIK